MDRSYELLSQEEPDADLAELAAQLGRFLFFAGRHDIAMQRIEAALEITEALSLPETFSHALNSKAIMLISHGRDLEGLALLQHALDVALEHDKPSAALRAYYNLADSLGQADRYEDAEARVYEGLALARRVGNRAWELGFLGQTYALFALGKWAELKAMAELLPSEQWVDARQAYGTVASVIVTVSVHQGRLDEAERVISMLQEFESSGDAQERRSHSCGKSCLLLASGDPVGALNLAEKVLATAPEIGFPQEYVKESFVTAVEAALELHDLEKADSLIRRVDRLPPGHSPQFLKAHSMRFRARMSDGDEAERLFKGATGLFRELAVPFYLATTQLEYAEWAASHGRSGDAKSLIEEARETFERLGAQPWVERAKRIGRLAQVPA
jgi:tetratricopeptide (TPR) repeat protein